MKYIYALPDHAKEMLKMAESETAAAVNKCTQSPVYNKLATVYTILQKINNEIKEANCG